MLTSNVKFLKYLRLALELFEENYFEHFILLFIIFM